MYRPSLAALVAGFISYLGLPAAPAAQLSWYPAALGGDGYWDTSSSTWYNAGRIGPWQQGSDAILSGTAGSVYIASDVRVASMRISNGYQINGYLNVDSPLTVNATGTVTIGGSFAGSALFKKTGSGTLVLLKPNPQSLSVEAGEYRGASNTYNQLSLDGTTAKIVFSSQSASGYIGLLSGSAGTLVPAASPLSSFGLRIAGGDTGAIIQDQGSTKVSVSVIGNLTFRSAQPYTGSTTLESGSLTLADAATFNSANALGLVKVKTSLVLDNGNQIQNRLPDQVPLQLSGNLTLKGNATQATTETVNSVIWSSYASITVLQPGSAPTKLVIQNPAQTAEFLTVLGNGTLVLAGATNQAGILPFNVTHGYHWASADNEFGVHPFNAYSDLNASLPSDNAQVSASAYQFTGSEGVVNTLKLNSGTDAPHTLNLAGRTLHLAAGGIMQEGTAPQEIGGGSITTSAASYFIKNQGTLILSTGLSDGPTKTGLDKVGPGTLELRGSDTLTGVITLRSGTLAITSAQNLAQAHEILVNDGILQARANTVLTPPLRAAFGTVSIDTNGFDLTLAASASVINKLGAGTLMLSNPFGQRVKVTAGTLRFSTLNQQTNFLKAEVYGATLDGVGSIESVQLFDQAELEIAGQGLGRLAIGSLDFDDTGSQVNLDIQGLQADLLQLAYTPNDPLCLNFRDLGNIPLGVPIKFGETVLVTGGFGQPPTHPYINLAFAQEALVAGWAGTFSQNADGIYVTFTATPEPGSTLLLATGGALLGLRRLRKQASISLLLA